MMMTKKKFMQLAAGCTLTLCSSLVLAADNTTPPPADHQTVVTAIEELGNRIEALTKAGVKTVNEVAYQIDHSFVPGMQLNVKQSDIQNRTREQTRVATEQAIKRDLQPFSSATLTYTNKSQPEVKKVDAETNARNNFIKQLKNLEASDSIYSLVQGIDISSYWTRKNLGQPGRNDDAFSFAALVEPEAYSPQQVINSENFIGYATRQYQSYADGINLDQLRTALMQYQKQGVKTLSQKIDQFSNNNAYKNYQLTVRSLTTTRSVATDILSGLAAERKPILTTEADAQLDAISRAIGVEPQVVNLKNAAGETITMYRYASPMQVAKFRANYRLNSQQWYQEVASDSTENLQRKSVVLLAEIASQLYQNHLDNEKMLGALAMLNLQSSDSASLLLKTQVNDLNAAISNFANEASGSSNPTTQPPSTNNPYTTEVPATQ
jgi:hypothetical protein